MALEPEILEIQEKQIVSLSREFTLETRNEIPLLWNEFWSREWHLIGSGEQAAFGVSYSAQPDGKFSYAVGLNFDVVPEPLPEGACIVNISGGRYAVFRNRGSVTEIPSLFDEIFEQWLPGSSEKQREGAVFERYPYDDNASPESMAYEIWVPVNN